MSLNANAETVKINSDMLLDRGQNWIFLLIACLDAQIIILIINGLDLYTTGNAIDIGVKPQHRKQLQTGLQLK